ncbi:MAG: ABC transporter substrate-binding protein, partial [Hyphomicrobiales bacterium]
FEWANKSLFHDLYARTQSFYDNSELSSHGRPADEIERSLLAKYPDAVPQDIMDGAHVLPKSDGSGRNRKNRRTATRLLKQAGYVVRDKILVNEKTGQPFRFEFVVSSREQERLALHFARSLKKLGIDLEVRQIDSAQMQKRRETFDFDMIEYTWYTSLSPGNEQTFYWGTAGRTRNGTRNYMGTAEPAIDDLIAALLVARDRPEFASAVRALDRVLLAGRYVIPLYHSPTRWTARWSHLKHPAETSLYGHQLDTWWRDQNQ